MEKHYKGFREVMRERAIERYKIDSRAVLFNGLKDFPRDQKSILCIYSIKRGKAGEFPEEIIGDEIACIEHIAREYLAQKCAFQDVLAKEGFDPTEEVLKDYIGRIATLSKNGTLTLLGKPRLKGNDRIVTMKRIHSPEYNCTGEIMLIYEDVKIGGRLCLSSAKTRGYQSSALIGLAINPNGAGDDILESRAGNTLVRKIEETYEENIAIPDKRLLDSFHKPIKINF